MLSSLKEVAISSGPCPIYLKPITPVPEYAERSTSPVGIHAWSASFSLAKGIFNCSHVASTASHSKSKEIQTVKRFPTENRAHERQQRSTMRAAVLRTLSRASRASWTCAPNLRTGPSVLLARAFSPSAPRLCDVNNPEFVAVVQRGQHRLTVTVTQPCAALAGHGMEDRIDVAAALKEVRLAISPNEGDPPVSGLAVAQVTQHDWLF